MKWEKGFSLIEVIVSIILLSLVALGFMKFAYPRVSFYQYNTAALLTEKKIEECRNVATLAAITTGDTNELVNGATYVCTVTRTYFDLNTTSPSGTGYTLTSGSLFTSATANQIARITVEVRLGSKTGQLLASRTAYIAAP